LGQEGLASFGEDRLATLRLSSSRLYWSLQQASNAVQKHSRSITFRCSPFSTVHFGTLHLRLPDVLARSAHSLILLSKVVMFLIRGYKLEGQMRTFKATQGLRYDYLRAVLCCDTDATMAVPKPF